MAESHAPIMQRRVKGLDNPWMTGSIRQMMSHRDAIKCKADKNKDPALYNEYRELRNNVTNACRKAKQEYYTNLLAENVNKPEKLWKSIKKILSPNSTQSTTMLMDDDGTHSDPNSISNAFNKYFSNIGSSLASKFPIGIQITNPYPTMQETFSRGGSRIFPRGELNLEIRRGSRGPPRPPAGPGGGSGGGAPPKLQGFYAF